MKKINKRRGFTLIEMMVVIVIIGILATLVVVNVSAGRRKAVSARAKSDVTEINKAIQMAITEGCVSFKVTTEGDIKCASPANLTRTYARAPRPSDDMVYSIVFGTLGSSETAYVDSSMNEWSCTPGMETGTPIKYGYYVDASMGFENPNANFECGDGDGTETGHNRPGCFCIWEDECK